MVLPNGRAALVLPISWQTDSVGQHTVFTVLTSRALHGTGHRTSRLSTRRIFSDYLCARTRCLDVYVRLSSHGHRGHVCIGMAVASLLNNTAMVEPSWVNTCYSVIAPGDGISVAMVYAYEGGKIVKVKGSGGLTGKYDAELRKREVLYAHSWFENITADTFG